MLAMGGWTLHISCTRSFIATNIFGTAWAMFGTSMPSVLSTLGRLLCDKKRLTSLSASARQRLQQDHVDEQIEIDAAGHKRKLHARNDVKDLSSASSFTERLSGLIPAERPSPESTNFAASAMKCYKHSQHVASHGLSEMVDFSLTM